MLQVGDRVRLAPVFNPACGLHCKNSSTIPVERAIGTVAEVSDRFGDHTVLVLWDLWHLGTQWTDRYRPNELVLAE